MEQPILILLIHLIVSLIPVGLVQMVSFLTLVQYQQIILLKLEILFLHFYQYIIYQFH